ncbi:39S ribosomal protein L21, mitochondrial [Nematostella vectensis]|uniref:39S ribosomal protein L21, mitochondrial n=1 Tax=Nematostella vectensis TaxID=45351 RepID=UPI0020773669|nr:39S ribosomal protein L21, mitochondrial [Nematostella vectensis]
MAARGVLRCANLMKIGVSLTRNAARKCTVEGLSTSTKRIQSLRSSLLVNSSFAKNSYRNFAVVAPAQSIIGDPLGLVGNVDVRSQDSSSLTEGASEEDDEQNCISSHTVTTTKNSDIISKVEDEMARGQNSGKVFAVVHIGGRQFKITVNDTITINRIDAEMGNKIRLEKVLLVGGENFTVIGRPLLERDLVTIFATVIEKTKTAKVIVFKKKRRKGYKRTRGHRQDITVLRINSILLNPSHLSTAAV